MNNKIAVIGATTNIGREILSSLAENEVDVKNVVAVDSKVSVGVEVSYGLDSELMVNNLDDYDFANDEIIIFASTEDITKKYAKKLASGGKKVIDVTGVFDTDTDVPMIINSVNQADIAKASKNIIAVPNSIASQIAVALKALHSKYQVERVITSTYQSVSYYGKEAMDELFNQTRGIYVNESPIHHKKIFSKQVAFNVLPQVSNFISGGDTDEEWKINLHLKKTLSQDIKVHANSAIIPTFAGSAAYVNIETKNDIDVEDVKEILKETEAVVLFDRVSEEGYVTPAEVGGEEKIYVSRLRQDITTENGISFWVVADTIKAAIAENVAKIIMSM